tara:strand:+ start:102 stop:728 length:627 start_codon:yes stop_codon:yes gene_type:complete
MKIICISDTHNKHEGLILPEADCIIHAGDFTDAGTKQETHSFLKWYSALPYKYKILIAGNHDFYLENNKENLKAIIPDNVYYLEDSGITIENIKIWGSPYIPGTGNWAFLKERGKAILSHWNKIPLDTNILITHGPPYGILDELDDKSQLGCINLKEKVETLKISYHVFGHVHNEYGTVKKKKTLFINSCSLDHRQRILNAPIVIISD